MMLTHTIKGWDSFINPLLLLTPLIPVTEETWLHSREIGKLPLSIDILSQQYIIECMAAEESMKDLFHKSHRHLLSLINQRDVSVFHAQRYFHH